MPPLVDLWTDILTNFMIKSWTCSQERGKYAMYETDLLLYTRKGCNFYIKLSWNSCMTKIRLTDKFALNPSNASKTYCFWHYTMSKKLEHYLPQKRCVQNFLVFIYKSSVAENKDFIFYFYQEMLRKLPIYW